jgi:hypothetical protein
MYLAELFINYDIKSLLSLEIHFSFIIEDINHRTLIANC